jgi:hypothetical protein
MHSLPSLQFPSYSFKAKNTEKGWVIFDIIRKKFVLLQPEEWVRQHLIHFLIDHWNISQSLMKVEHKVTTGQINSRFDLAVFKSDGYVHLLAECKAPSVVLDQKVIHQSLRYCEVLQPDYLLITNGLTHKLAQLNREDKSYTWLSSINEFQGR